MSAEAESFKAFYLYEALFPEQKCTLLLSPDCFGYAYQHILKLANKSIVHKGSKPGHKASKERMIIMTLQTQQASINCINLGSLVKLRNRALSSAQKL